MKKAVLLMSFLSSITSLSAMSKQEKADTLTHWDDIILPGSGHPYYLDGEKLGRDLYEDFRTKGMMVCDKTGKFIVLDGAAAEKLINTLLLHSANKNEGDALNLAAGLLGIYWDRNSTFGYIDRKPIIHKYRNGFEKKDFVEGIIRTFRLDHPDKKVDQKVIHMLKTYVTDTLQQRRFDESIGLGEACKIIKEAIKN